MWCINFFLCAMCWSGKPFFSSVQGRRTATMILHFGIRIAHRHPTQEGYLDRRHHRRPYRCHHLFSGDSPFLSPSWLIRASSLSYLEGEEAGSPSICIFPGHPPTPIRGEGTILSHEEEDPEGHNLCCSPEPVVLWRADLNPLTYIKNKTEPSLLLSRLLRT